LGIVAAEALSTGFTCNYKQEHRARFAKYNCGWWIDLTILTLKSTLSELNCTNYYIREVWEIMVKPNSSSTTLATGKYIEQNNNI
jgi:hypothetical protein